jgi:tetratricopeptide (TPR) repeat protein
VEGISNLKHALLLDPNNVEAMMALGNAYRDAQRYAEARELYARVQKAQPLNLQAHHHLALMLYATGALPEAREAFLAVINQARDKGELKDDGLPIPGPGILGSGLYMGPKKRLVAGFTIPEAAADLAILEALQDLDRHPGNGLLWQNIGSALLELDLPYLALDALRKSGEREPDLSETRFLMGVAYRRLGDQNKARAELSAAITRNPLHPRARLELAQLFTEAGDLERAQAEVSAHARNYPLQRPGEPRRSSNL